MKTLNQTFTDDEYEKLLEEKGKKNWHQFILELVEDSEEDDEV